MTLSSMAKRAEKLIADNSPNILTGLGVAGVVTTAYLTGKASFKAAELLMEARTPNGYPSEIEIQRADLEPREKLELTWKLYLPAVSVGTASIVCIIGANRVGTRRAAAMAAAYSVTERAFAEYKDKVVEKFGETQEREVRDEVAQDRVRRTDGQAEVVVMENEVLCFDSFTGRYFKSTMETLKKAQNDTNYQILNDCYASLGDFYNRIGLSATTYSEEVGWSSNNLLELEFSTVLSDDGKPCISIDFKVQPIRDYYRVH